jgi:hypothetical protein
MVSNHIVQHLENERNFEICSKLFPLQSHSEKVIARGKIDQYYFVRVYQKFFAFFCKNV